MARFKKASTTVRALRAETKRQTSGGPVTPEDTAQVAEVRVVKKPLSSEDRKEARRIQTQADAE
ncbi:hypothetical protein [Streptomyces nitrosporeus]|uniref:hypothetical protein n=1 Tax=Streptomyces nitrosporeus TaxID=28894 RepID=UPI0039A0F333